MIAKAKLDRMDRTVRAFLDKRFSDESMYKSELLDLWTTYRDLGLPNEDFVAELTSGKDSSLAQRGWEMQLAQHLHNEGHALTCLGRGPDLRFEHDGQVIWVEATAPNPEGLPDDWLAPDWTGVKTFPHEKILLRWTTALDAKWKKLIEYRQKGIVQTTDAYVIAINGCQLSAFPDDRGITQMPFGVEAVFPVGPWTLRLNPEDRRVEESFISERFHIINANGAPVATTPFIDPKYAGVSAIIGSAARMCYGKPLAAHVVHNPLAEVRVPQGVLGAEDDEWFAVPIDAQRTEFDLKRAVRTPPEGT